MPRKPKPDPILWRLCDRPAADAVTELGYTAKNLPCDRLKLALDQIAGLDMHPVSLFTLAGNVVFAAGYTAAAVRLLRIARMS